jgi:hypothetical protein
MARAWKPRPIRGLLTKLGGSRGDSDGVPVAFRRSTDGSVEFVRRDGTTGRASYWARLATHKHWGVDLERRAYVALVLLVEDSGGVQRVHTGRWDTARGVAWTVRECEPPAPPLWAST